MSSESNIQLPTDGIGKKVRTTEVVVGADTVEQQVIQVANSSDAIVNPATAEKQDDIIAALGGGNYAKQIAEVGDVLYVGEAAIGSATGSAVWRIKKVDSASGIVITWADGNGNFDNIWNDYATMTYS